LRSQLQAVLYWTDSRGKDHTVLIRRSSSGVELEETIQHAPPGLYSGNRTIRTVEIPADPQQLRTVARALLNIAKWEEGSVAEQ
jgi:hypothetical protein